MSKYIIELDDRIKLVTSVGVTEHGVVYTTSGYVHNLEELNSDYINEHFSDLQDAAYKKGLHDGESKCRYCNEYQRGFEDGKAVNDKGCEGCMWEGNPYDACEQCSNAHKNLWTAMQKTDEIKVGDEMKQVTESGTETGLRCTVTAIDGDRMNGYSQDGRAVVCSSQVNRWWKKTGRHFNIESILEEMHHES